MFKQSIISHGIIRGVLLLVPACINAQCITQGNISVSYNPPMPAAGYSPGQTVQICVTINSFNQLGANWMHGVYLSNFGSGWNPSTYQGVSAPTPPTGQYIWASNFTSTAFGAFITNPGWYMDLNYDGNPGNNYGQSNSNGPFPRTFCFSIQTANSCAGGSSLSFTIHVTSDGQTGSWANGSCGPIPTFTPPPVSMNCGIQVTLIPTHPSCTNPCNGAIQVQVTGGSGNYSYSWNQGPGGSNPTGLCAGSYTVTVTDLNTSLTGTASVTLMPPPPMNIAITPASATICSGQSTTLTASGAQSYSWSPATGLNTTTGATVTASPSVTTSYTVTATTAANCTGTATATVTVLPLPTASFAAPAAACVGQPVTITYTGNAPANANYTWNFPNATILSGSGQGPFQVSWPSAGTYTLSLTVELNGCVSTPFTQQIVIQSAPTASFILSPSAACAGSPVTITYTGNAGAGAAYTWDFGNGTVQAGSGAGPYQVLWNTAGSYTVSLTVSENGCTSATNSQQITIHPIPASSFTVTSPLCPGQAGLISYTGTAGAGATYQWDFGSGTVQSGTGQGPYQVSWPTSGTYTVSLTVTENGCVSSVTSQNVVVQPTPTASFSLAASGCPGVPVIVSYTGASGPGATYTWDFGTGAVLSGSGQGPYQISWNTPGTYPVSLTVTDNGCASQPASQNIIIHPQPTADFSISGAVCPGEGAVITYSGSAGAGAIYSWDFDGGSVQSGSGQGPFTVSWPLSGSYTVTLTVTENGCTSVPFSQVATVYPTPTSSFSLNASACTDESVTVIYTGTGGAAADYTWDFGLATVLSGSGQGPYQLSWGTAGSYSISLVVSENNCSSLPTVQTITIYSYPTADFTATGPVCVDEAAVLTYTGTGGPGATFSWNLDGGTLQSGSGGGPLQVLWNTAGTYTPSLVVTENGCTSQSFSAAVTVHPIPTAQFSAPSSVCSGAPAQITYTGTGSAGATYDWTVSGNGVIQSGTGQGPLEIVWTQAGVETVELVVTENGCVSPSFSQSVTVQALPTADFTAPAAVCVNQNGTFTYVGNAPANATFQWDFEGGTIASGSGVGPYQVSWNTAGTYTVSLTVTHNGCTSQPFTADVTVHPIPTSDFASTAACLGQTSTITYTGTASPSATYQWNFGSGTIQSGSDQGPYEILWSNGGNSQISLTVTENGCTSSTTTLPVTVFTPPTAAFTNNNAYCAGGVTHILFTGTAGPNATYDWNFGNGTVQSGSGAGPYEVVFPNVGQETISLVVTENGCSSAPAVATVTINPFPVVSIIPQPPQCLGQNSFSWSATGTFGPTAAYYWVFAGGTPYSSNDPNPQNITWSAPGTYAVQLTMVESGCHTQVWEQAIIYPDPTPSFTADNTSGCVPLQVTFTNTTQAQEPMQVQWQFGNGTSGAGNTVTALYDKFGNYTVSMTVTDAYGCIVTASVPGFIQAHPVPVAGFTPNPYVVELDNALISITDNSQFGNSWHYTFGDGGWSTSRSPSHIYSEIGEYVIRQVVSNAFGCSDTAYETVWVNPVSEIFIPNSFTPNGDGINDVWQPVMSYIKTVEIRVFDRWGEEVFYSDDIYNGWDGRHAISGEPMKQDTYVYTIRYRDYAGRTRVRKGSVTLIR